MIQLFRTNSSDIDFQNLVKELDNDLSIRDGEEHLFYSQFNKLDAIKHVIVVYDDDEPIGCGAIKIYSDKIVEIKRMYVTLEKRGNGIATMVLKELEKWSKELGCDRCILETGINQPEALHLYEKNNYQKISNYAQYQHIESSICFGKDLKQKDHFGNKKKQEPFQ